MHAPRPVSVGRVLLEQLRSFVVVLLALAAVGAALMGDRLEAAAIAAVLVVNTVVGAMMELRARRAMEALMRLDVPSASVVRSGVAQVVDAHDLVPGDVIHLEPGQHVPADARLLVADGLAVNEAPLSGESLPVEKSVPAVATDTALPDRACMAYKGTTITVGNGVAVVVATGMKTEIGRIGTLLVSFGPERTPLELRLDALGRRLAWVAIAAGVLVAVVASWRGAAFETLVETALALAIAAVPEGLPVVATIALAVGMHRMARRHALIRRLPAVESLGSVTVICSDKTGTLTAGEMTLTTIALSDGEIEIGGSGYVPVGEFTRRGRRVAPLEDARLRLLLQVAALANRADVHCVDDVWRVRGDPTEAALLVAARKAGLDRAALLAASPEVGAVPFSSDRMTMATFHRIDGGRVVAHLKGAPRRVLEHCDRILVADGERALDDAARQGILTQNDALAGRGLRVLALATGPIDVPEADALQGLTYLGLVGMLDAPADGVRETLRDLRAAGIRTTMITGDQRRTAEAIARELGILVPGDVVLDASELRHLSREALAHRVGGVAAFSRVSPEDKLAIVRAYQESGEVVAMLGDGVNDAPALRQADVGVCMGRRGTDVAREASDVVLQDDRFATITVAVEQGRVIFDNIRKFVFYLFSCNLAEVLVLLAAGIAGWPLPLAPMQILWLNLVTDTFPALALAVEPAEGEVMRRGPRDPVEAVLSARFVTAIGVYAAAITLVTLAAFAIAVTEDGGAGPRAVTMCFATLGLAQGLHLGNARRRTAVLAPRAILANGWALAAAVFVAALQVIAVQSPLGRILHTVPLSARDWMLVTLLAALPAVGGQASRQRPPTASASARSSASR